ncbi:STAS domain-containing protein [Lihuaxuella thermophila]|uniref:Anti-sigma factor antagonist n=1 Tax=Lihuaxuella thermophila TaxID=1173111 RepID=A0A1H8G5C6_9BACL|nr:STAS domain-containing protein [Lihuaxuella thermophila]SEN38970.1 anti-sigma B factor antagonist [Lihuaxuella thermophila]
MNLQVKEKMDDEKNVTLCIEGEVDVYTAPKLREKLLPLCQEGKTVTVDLSKCVYIDSTGLGVFIGAYKMQRGTDGKLILKGMNSRLLRLFKITGLHEIMKIEESAQEDGQP